MHNPRNDNLLAAARALLAARADEMVTADEWEALERAVAACDEPAQSGEARDGPQAPHAPRSPGS